MGLQVYFLRGAQVMCITALVTYINEYYPTVIRSSAYGVLKAIGRTGSIAGFCLWWDLDVVKGLSFIAILCCFSLPFQIFLEDTTKKELYNSLDKAPSKEVNPFSRVAIIKRYVS